MTTYSDIVKDDLTGEPIPGVSVYVYNLDKTLATITPTNPVITDSYGEYTFDAADDIYRISYVVGGKTVEKDYIIVGNGPNIPVDVIAALIPFLTQINASTAAAATSASQSSTSSTQSGAFSNSAGLYAAAAAAAAIGLFDDTASGITATTSTTNKYFLVKGSGNTYAELWKNVAGTATDQNLALASAAAIPLLRSDVSTLATTGAYTNLLHGLSVVITNRTDGTTGTATLTETSDGLQISNAAFNKAQTFTTNIALAAPNTRLITTIKIGGTIGSPKVGLAFVNGSNYASVTWQNNGWLIASSNYGGGPSGIISQALSTYASGTTVTMQFDVDASGNVYVTCSVGTGKRVCVGFSGLPFNTVELALFDDTTTATAAFKIAEQAMGSVASGAAKTAAGAVLTSDFRGPRVAAQQFFAPYERKKPTGFTAALLPSWFHAYYDPGHSRFFTTLDLQPVLDENDPTVFTQYVDIATGNDANAGTSAAPLKSIIAAVANCGAGCRANIRIKGGLYDFANCWKSANSAAAVIQAVSWDGNPVISSMHDSGLSWSLVTGATYSATFANGVVNVFDAHNLTSDGDYSILTLAASLAACQASIGVIGATSIVGGSGGTNGTFPIAFSGGGSSGAEGVFTVSGGALTSITITLKGVGYTSAPAMSFAASPGLSGASAVATLGPVGSYFISGTTINVHTIDGRAPDSNIRVYKKAASDTSLDYNGFFYPTANQTVYLENIRFEGGNFALLGQNNDTTTQLTFYHKNCTFKYAGNSSPIWNANALVLGQLSIAAWNATDGFHYNPALFDSTTAITAVEQDCIGRWNGTGGDPVNNNSSNHDGATIRISTQTGFGVYHHAQQRGIHDIFQNLSANSWHMGITSRDTRNGFANFTIGLGLGAPKMWNDNCVSSGATFDEEAQAGATIFNSGFTGSATNTGAGTITPYTP